MNVLELGLNIGIIVGIIGLTTVIKQLDKKEKKFKRYYVLVPVFFGLVAAFAVTTPLSVQGVLQNGIAYAGVAALAYMARKKLAASGIPLEPPEETP